MERNIGWRGGGRKRSGWMGRGEKEGRDRTTRKEREWEKVKGKINENIAREVGNVQIRILTRISNSCLQVHSTCTYRFHVQVYSGTSHCGHLGNKDTFLIWTLAFVPIVVKKNYPELRTPLQSEQLDGSQWCPQYRGSTVSQYRSRLFITCNSS